MNIFPEHSSLSEKLLTISQCLFLLSGAAWATTQAVLKLYTQLKKTNKTPLQESKKLWIFLLSFVVSTSGISFLTYQFMIKPYDAWASIYNNPKIWPLTGFVFLLTCVAFLFIIRIIKRS